jgi:hypothetical protein
VLELEGALDVLDDGDGLDDEPDDSGLALPPAGLW